ncbi:Molybdenum cofactor sulfurase, C-terminal [Penicillium expansum]|uniref:Molybdenum cofactor sulfurase, C-terminal n=1 Tax=Penicillium expansum TaxID=27334 RepID=A0A0A2KD31_PENEN|nr:Molybdenum cofactor sulfurase, C-terminal [Penicillium expansum]KGO39557.1 Molybdenum cofactor sulfurase, C-terminal [Penicillium expansum]KGO62557.1 Molybdenum cofactor sulfurase, C-terminal [Penicillium expansum]KGO64868.1 Molybdenum cofactor sulfurase, C-terminal [Penicillium expansum]
MKVSQLYVYPIKSLRPTTITEGILTTRGFQYDRHFMLLKVIPAEDGSGTTTLKNMHVPHFPEMALFHTDIEYPQTEKDSGKLIITHHPPPLGSASKPRETSRLEIPLQPNPKTLNPLKVMMHQSPTTGYNMGAEYNDWFSACFGYPVVLAYLGPNSREVLGTLAPAKKDKKTALHTIRESLTNPDRKWERVLPILIVASAINILLQGGTIVRDGITPQTARTLTPTLLFTASAAVLYYFYALYTQHEDRITFADCAPYLVISETSVDNVSARLPDGEKMDRTKFRPNVVVSGAGEAFEEDFWGALTVGNGLGHESSKLLLTGNCVRCQSLNVDYETGKMGTGESGAVLKKLMKDRRVDSGAKFSPVFGRYAFLEPKGEGNSLRVGDEIAVAEKGTSRSIFDWPGMTN